MGLIKYDEKTVLNAKTNIDICNGNILDALQKLNNELLNMESTMSTPKSTKAIATFTEYFNDRTRFVVNSREKYNQMLTNINNEYNEYMNGIKEMVGGKE